MLWFSLKERLFGGFATSNLLTLEFILLLKIIQDFSSRTPAHKFSILLRIMYACKVCYTTESMVYSKFGQGQLVMKNYSGDLSQSERAKCSE